MSEQPPNFPPHPQHPQHPQPYPHPQHPQPPYPSFQAGYRPPTPPPKRPVVWPWIVGGITAVVLLCCGIGVAANIGASDDTEPAAVATAQATSPEPTTSAPSSTAPSTAAPTTPAAAPTTTPAAATPKPAPKPTYKKLGAREWKLIVKNPDAYIGKTYVVYGVVTQFDAATGDGVFRADVAHKQMAYSFEYETNTLLTGSTTKLKNVVEDDEFRANVTVLGSFSYDTQIGGSTTVPLLEVNSIKIL
ncbi:MAG TPA: hypothetical protein VFX60_11935 [Micromonospora sp.]|nr:hypothetical protein [Micromonospora sp.]